MNDHTEIRYFGDLQRLETKPGDLFVLSVECALSIEQHHAIQNQWKGAVGDAKLLVLERGMRLGVVSGPQP